MDSIEFILDLAALFLSIPVVVLVVEVISACLPRQHEIVPSSKSVRAAILVPAHDEEEGIAATIDSILPQLRPGDRLVVVADNCSDGTARIASEKGAEVIERHDPSQRGKGFAIDFGVRFLAQNAPDIVLIVDADCMVEVNALAKVVAYSAYTDHPVQCLYLMHSPKGTGPTMKLSEFAWILKNQVRPLGLAKLGLPCQLMGTGMAFPWSAINQVNLANGNLVEDMKLGLDLCQSGHPPLFYEQALVSSQFPLTSKARSHQRTRWEHGHLSMIFSRVPGLILRGIIHCDKNLLAMTMDLSVPPLALLAAMLIGFLLIGIVACLVGLSSAPLLITATSIMMFSVAILLAWWGWGRGAISPLALVTAPLYVAAKIPYYIKFLFNRQRQWVRTDRKNRAP
jgi:cellulose synthase/poly-beta-1,6-N-acetylglucosamine synthase-like glycosyltransferase